MKTFEITETITKKVVISKDTCSEYCEYLKAYNEYKAKCYKYSKTITDFKRCRQCLNDFKED
jgi:hypothetical protein